MDAIRGLAFHGTINNHGQNGRQRYERRETFAMFNAVLQDRHRRIVRAKPFQPLRRARDIVSLGGHDNPIHCRSGTGIGHNRRPDADRAIRRLDCKPGQWPPHAEDHLMPAGLFEQRGDHAANRPDGMRPWP